MRDIQVASEDALIIYFGNEISRELTQEIIFYADIIQQELAEFIIDIIPSYCSLFIRYRIDNLDYDQVYLIVQGLLKKYQFEPSDEQPITVEIPVFYHPSVGFDLEALLSAKQLSLAEFITLHSQQSYCVHAIGFSPAFAFLGQLNPKLCSARLATPRVRIPAGSVGIADSQTAVYPINSAGGWNIIARTPIDLSLSNPDNLTLFAIGQTVRFKPIDEQEYLDLGGLL